MEVRLQYLFRRYIDNTCTQEELEEFLDYIHQADHDEELRQLISEVYEELKADGANIPHVDEHGRLVLDNLPAHEPEIYIPKNIPQPSLKRRHRLSTAGYLVPVIAIIIITVALITTSVNRAGEKPLATAALTKKTTDRSESKFILLEDSTQVWLNAATSLEFPDRFDKKKREVYLSGEAYFDVKHADKTPFIIHTGDISVTVLGTAFNIKAYPGQKNITVAVSRGKVKITRKDGSEITLVKDQQVKLNGDSQETTGKNIPGEMIAGWQQGHIHYDGEPLKDIISDMERVYNVSISIENQSVAHQEISTSFKKEIGIEQALQVLCKLTDTGLKKTKNGYIIQ